MRDQSLSLRILVLAVLLLAVTAFCVVMLVAIGALHPRIAHMLAAGGVILILAILAAAISALGPKYRPTPLLTPLFAGIFAALLASSAIYAVQAHVAPKRSAIAAAEATAPIQPAAKPAAEAKAQPVEAAPMVASAEPGPPAAPKEQARFVPNFDPSDFAPAPTLPTNAEAPAPPAVQPVATGTAQPPPQDAANGGAMDAASGPATNEPSGGAMDAPAVDQANAGPAADVANVAEPPAQAAAAPADTGAAKKEPMAVAKIPVPAAAPGASKNAATPVNLVAGFDPSGPTVPEAAGPPMALDAADAAPAHRATIPPLPRIRPCGGAGPACP